VKSWYSIRNLAQSTEVFLYDEVGAWGVSANDFVKELRDIKAPVIDLRVSSPGGDVFDGVAIYNALKNHPATVNVIIDGLAASAASFICQAGDRIAIARNAQMMIHEAHAVAVGNSKDMAAMTQLLETWSDNIADMYAQRAGGTVADWRARMRAETWYTAEEAVKAGLADEVAGPGRKAANAWDLTVFNFAGRDKAPDPFGLVPPAVQAVVADVEPEVEPVETTDTEPDEPMVEMPASTESEPEQEPVPTTVDFDPAAFRTAMARATELPFNPADFRDAMQAAAGSAPAPPQPERRPVDLGPLPPSPPAEPSPGPWDAIRTAMTAAANDAPAPPRSQPRPVDLGPMPQPPPAEPPPPELGVWDAFRAAMTVAANDAPAPPQPPQTHGSPADEPGFAFDASSFRAALRRAHSE
jgi:ATP-dependent protease ClpP protease subunit